MGRRPRYFFSFYFWEKRFSLISVQNTLTILKKIAIPLSFCKDKSQVQQSSLYCWHMFLRLRWGNQSDVKEFWGIELFLNFKYLRNVKCWLETSLKLFFWCFKWLREFKCSYLQHLSLGFFKISVETNWSFFPVIVMFRLFLELVNQYVLTCHVFSIWRLTLCFSPSPHHSSKWILLFFI